MLGFVVVVQMSYTKLMWGFTKNTLHSLYEPFLSIRYPSDLIVLNYSQVFLQKLKKPTPTLVTLGLNNSISYWINCIVWINAHISQKLSLVKTPLIKQPSTLTIGLQPVTNPFLQVSKHTYSLSNLLTAPPM